MNRWERIYTDVNSRYLQQHRGKRRNNGPPSLPCAHTNSDTHAGRDAYRRCFLLSYTHTHTHTHHLQYKDKVDCLKTQSTAGLFGQLLQMMIQSQSHHNGTGSGRAGGKNRSTTSTISRSSCLPACDSASFFSVCQLFAFIFPSSPPLAEDE